MQILQIDNDAHHDWTRVATAVLKAGGLVVYPTETTYGIAADVENPAAIEKLLAYKGKRDNKPLSVLVVDEAMAGRYVQLNDTAKQVYETFLPGPVTVVSTGKGIVAPGVPSPDGKVGIRISSHAIAQVLVHSYGIGLTATGANASNKKRPYTVQDILDNISDKQKDLIDLILDAGELPPNEPSTVIDTTLDDITVLRQGQKSFGAQEEHTTDSVEETIEFFAALAKRFRSYYGYQPVVFALSGEMGAGKTHAVKGLALGLGISERITSPTYTLANEYQFENEQKQVRFLHIDAWRMKTIDELLSVGLDEQLVTNGVTAIEWADRFDLSSRANNAHIVFVFITQGKTLQSRSISLSVEHGVSHISNL